MKAAIYFLEKYMDQVYTLDISQEIKNTIRNTKNVGRSKPCIFEIKNRAVLPDLSKLMQLKVISK